MTYKKATLYRFHIFVTAYLVFRQQACIFVQQQYKKKKKEEEEKKKKKKKKKKQKGGSLRALHCTRLGSLHFQEQNKSCKRIWNGRRGWMEYP